ncbi:MAG: hypothetical protein AMXMBFR85_05210 [Dehalococcoides mccartyi]
MCKWVEMVNRPELPNKPLIEALFEYKWKIPDDKIDSNYQLFVGKLYNKLEAQYPFYQPLDLSAFPPGIVKYQVAHRFRKAENIWPIVQVGHGVVTLNNDHNYTWPDFEKRIYELFDSIYSTYPEPAGLQVQSMSLRYRDAFDLQKDEEALIYMKKYLKSEIKLPNSLFDDASIASNPKIINSFVVYDVLEPKGQISLKFSSGMHNNVPSLIMDTCFSSQSNELTNIPHNFKDWLNSAHQLTDSWFFKLIDGELLEGFSNAK